MLILTLSQTIEEWNDKLNAFSEKYLDSPWAGTIILIVLVAFGYWAIGEFNKK